MFRCFVVSSVRCSHPAIERWVLARGSFTRSLRIAACSVNSGLAGAHNAPGSHLLAKVPDVQRLLAIRRWCFLPNASQRKWLGPSTGGDIGAIAEPFRRDRRARIAIHMVFSRARGYTLDHVSTLPRRVLRYVVPSDSACRPSLSLSFALYRRYKTLYKLRSEHANV
jgi:hypothetical protein